ncbi:MAG: hypothetical protein ACXW3Y_05920 [Rhodoplanes sp.]
MSAALGDSYRRSFRRSWRDADVMPLLIEIRPGVRMALAYAVEAFLNLLAQIDADAELEGDNPSEDDAPCEAWAKMSQI